MHGRHTHPNNYTPANPVSQIQVPRALWRKSHCRCSFLHLLSFLFQCLYPASQCGDSIAMHRPLILIYMAAYTYALRTSTKFDPTYSFIDIYVYLDTHSSNKIVRFGIFLITFFSFGLVKLNLSLLQIIIMWMGVDL